MRHPRILIHSLAATAIALLCAAPGALAEEPPMLNSDIDAQVTVEGPYRVVSANEVRFELPFIGSESRLYVKDADETVVYTGSDLDKIITANPTLKDRAEILAIRTKLGNLEPASPESAAWHYRVVNGPVFYEDWRGSENARLFIQDGARTRVYTGKDLQTILSAHPQVAERSEIAGIRTQLAPISELTWHEKTPTDAAGTAALDLTIRPNETVVVVHNDGPEGPEAQTLRGENLMAICKANPDLHEMMTDLWFEAPAEASSSN